MKYRIEPISGKKRITRIQISLSFCPVKSLLTISTMAMIQRKQQIKANIKMKISPMPGINISIPFVWPKNKLIPGNGDGIWDMEYGMGIGNWVREVLIR